MTRNFKLFLGATLIFYFIAAVNDARAMYVLAGASLAVILGAYVLSRLAVSALELSAESSRSRGKAGTPVPISLRLANLRSVTRPTPTVTLRVENATVSGVERAYRFVLPNLDARARVEFEATVEAPTRGRYHLADLAVEGNDPIGMFRRPRHFTPPPGYLVLPQTYTAPGIAAWELLSPAGRRVARGRRRDAGDFGGIREYSPGDDLRYVHWKAFAHTGNLAIKQFEQRQDAQIAVWLDLSASGVVGTGAGASTEISISLAASMLQTFVAADYTVQLTGDGLSQSLALPSKGEAYLTRALQALAEAQATAKRPFSALVMERVRSAGNAHAIFAITTPQDGALLEAFTFCGARGLAPVVFICDPGGPTAASTEMLAKCRHVGLVAIVVTGMEDIPRAMREAASLGERQIAT